MESFFYKYLKVLVIIVVIVIAYAVIRFVLSFIFKKRRWFRRLPKASNETGDTEKHKK